MFCSECIDCHVDKYHHQRTQLVCWFTQYVLGKRVTVLLDNECRFQFSDQWQYGIVHHGEHHKCIDCFDILYVREHRQLLKYTHKRFIGMFIVCVVELLDFKHVSVRTEHVCAERKPIALVTKQLCPECFV